MHGKPCSGLMFTCGKLRQSLAAPAAGLLQPARITSAPGIEGVRSAPGEPRIIDSLGESGGRGSMDEYQASLVIRAGAQSLLTASGDPRSDQGYAGVKANISAALDLIADALRNFEAGTGASGRAAEWAADLNRVADDLGT